MEARGALIEAEGAPAACTNAQPALYALDTMIPVLDLHQEDACTIGRAPGRTLFGGFDVPLAQENLFQELALWRWAKALYGVFGAFLVGFAILTWSGVFKPRAKE